MGKKCTPSSLHECQILKGRQAQFARLLWGHLPARQQAPEIVPLILEKMKKKKNWQNTSLVRWPRYWITHTHTQTNYLVLLHEECMSNTLFTSPSSPPNSVDIVLCGQRKTIVDHHFNIRNIQSSSSYVSSYLRVYGHVNRTNRLLEIVNDHYRSSHVEMRPFQSILSCACTCKKTQKLSNKIQ